MSQKLSTSNLLTLTEASGTVNYIPSALLVWVKTSGGGAIVKYFSRDTQKLATLTVTETRSAISTAAGNLIEITPQDTTIPAYHINQARIAEVVDDPNTSGSIILFTDGLPPVGLFVTESPSAIQTLMDSTSPDVDDFYTTGTAQTALTGNKAVTGKYMWVTPSVTATGATNADAFQLTTNNARITEGGAATGVLLALGSNAATSGSISWAYVHNTTATSKIVYGASSQPIGGAASVTLGNDEAMYVVWDGSVGWDIVWRGSNAPGVNLMYTGTIVGGTPGLDGNMVIKPGGATETVTIHNGAGVNHLQVDDDYVAIGALKGLKSRAGFYNHAPGKMFGTITGGGALSQGAPSIRITAAGPGEVYTLAGGIQEGQELTVQLVAGADPVTITPANTPAGYTSVTLTTNLSDEATFVWSQEDSNWKVSVMRGATVALVP